MRIKLTVVSNKLTRPPAFEKSILLMKTSCLRTISENSIIMAVDRPSVIVAPHPLLRSIESRSARRETLVGYNDVELTVSCFLFQFLAVAHQTRMHVAHIHSMRTDMLRVSDSARRDRLAQLVAVCHHHKRKLFKSSKPAVWVFLLIFFYSNFTIRALSGLWRKNSRLPLSLDQFSHPKLFEMKPGLW